MYFLFAANDRTCTVHAVADYRFYSQVGGLSESNVREYVCECVHEYVCEYVCECLREYVCECVLVMFCALVRQRHAHNFYLEPPCDLR